MSGTALVTGAAGNLGLEHASALQAAGYHVVLTDVDEDRLANRVRNSADVDASRLTVVPMDVTNEASVADAARRLYAERGALAVLVNNAQGSDPAEDAPFERFPLEAWRRIQDVNLTGTFLCCKHFGSQMARARAGSIINLSSVYGAYSPDLRIYESMGFASPAVYTATKAGIVGLTRYLAAYWAKANVRVNCISPGGVRMAHAQEFVDAYSARVPMGRMARPDEIRGVVRWLASDASSYVTGQNIFVDGGLSAW